MSRIGGAAALLGVLLGTSSFAFSSHGAAAQSEYTVRAGDNLWTIARNSHVPVSEIVAENHIRNPKLIFPGQRLKLGPPPKPAPPPKLSRPQAKALLVAAAQRHGLKPAFVEAVSWWESGWDQDAKSPDGAIGLMQIMPGTGAYAGPQLLQRRVDLHNAPDNADLGAALLRAYLDEFDDPKLALAAYYQGPNGVRHHHILKSSQHYADGIWTLRNRIEKGDFPY